MTAAQAAAALNAKIAAAMAAHNAGTLSAPGVFSLEQLKALGKTGDVRQDWINQGSGAQGGLIAGGGNAVLTAKGLKAGYYQIPGQAGAEYYDPASGQASKEFIDWANALTPSQRDPFTGQPKGFIPAEGGPEAAFSARYDQSPAGIAAVDAIIAGGRGADGTYQDSQDRALGLGKYQQFMLGANGEQLRVSDVLAKAAGPAAKATFRDVSPDKTGAFDRLGKELGMTDSELNDFLSKQFYSDSPTKDSLGNYLGSRRASATNNIFTADLSKMNQEMRRGYETFTDAPGGGLTSFWTDTSYGAKETVGQYYTDLKNSLAANYEQNLLAQQGLRRERIARGEDPVTGQSVAEAKQIYDTLKRISNPAERNAYLMGQDPGNLTAGELAKYNELKAPEIAAATDKKWDTREMTHFFQGQYVPGEITVTSGNKIFKDDKTGRSTLISGVPYKIDYKAPEATGGTFLGHKMSAGTTNRIIGGMMEASLGLATGGIMGAVAGAYIGSGGPLPDARDISFKKGGGWSRWRSGPPQALDEGFAMQALLAVATAGLAKAFSAGKGAFMSKYFPSEPFVGPRLPPSMLSQFLGGALTLGMAGVSNAKGRQAQQDMLQARQRTWG